MLARTRTANHRRLLDRRTLVLLLDLYRVVELLAPWFADLM